MSDSLIQKKKTHASEIWPDFLIHPIGVPHLVADNSLRNLIGVNYLRLSNCLRD